MQSIVLVKVYSDIDHVYHMRLCACAEQASVPIRDVQLGRHEREFELYDPRDAQRVVATIKVRAYHALEPRSKELATVRTAVQSIIL